MIKGSLCIRGLPTQKCPLYSQATTLHKIDNWGKSMKSLAKIRGKSAMQRKHDSTVLWPFKNFTLSRSRFFILCTTWMHLLRIFFDFVLWSSHDSKTATDAIFFIRLMMLSTRISGFTYSLYNQGIEHDTCRLRLKQVMGRTDGTSPGRASVCALGDATSRDILASGWPLLWWFSQHSRARGYVHSQSQKICLQVEVCSTSPLPVERFVVTLELESVHIHRILK